MKKIISIPYILLLLTTSVLLINSSCKKFLDRKPLEATLDDLKQGGIEGLVFGLYSSIRDYNDGAAFNGLGWQAMHNFRADDSRKGSGASDQADMTVIFEQYQYSKDFWTSNGYWDSHYAIINLANTALQTADSLALEGPGSMANIAEVKFMRAYSYFDLVRVFGEVPKIDFRVYNVSQANIAKSTTDKIYELIDADLQYASANLPASWGNKYPGRLTSGAARTLWAKSYLYRKNFPMALGQLQSVISSGQYSLFSSYYGIFKDANENCSESILEWQSYMGPNQTDDYGSWYATVQNIRKGAATNDWDLGWGFNVPTDAFVNSFDPGDKRKAASILFSGQNDDPASGGYGLTLPNWVGNGGPLDNAYWNKKVYSDPAMRAYTGWLNGAYWMNQRVYRYADVLLMAAECLNEAGGTANTDMALSYVNLVRARAGLGDITFTTQNALRTSIKNERKFELGLEGERFFDLVRWIPATDGIDALNVLGSSGYVAKCKFYPIPQNVIDKSNGILLQNPDWN